MEYDKTADGVIRASLAARVGALLCQYDSLPPSVSNFDATLALIALQFLLTNCSELIDSGGLEGLENIKNRPLVDVPNLCGLGRHMVTKFFPGEEEPTFAEVVKHLRHSVSHPLYPDCVERPCKDEQKPRLPTTGFYQIIENKKVAAFGFVHSPEVTNKGDRCYSRKKFGGGDKRKFEEFQCKSKSDLEKIRRTYRKISDEIEKIESLDGKLVEFKYQGNLFLPVFSIEIPIDQLKLFIKELSNLMSEPLKSCLPQIQETLTLSA